MAYKSSVAATVAVLLITACAGSSDEAGPASTAAPEATEASATSEATEVTDTTEAGDATAAPATTAAPSDSAAGTAPPATTEPPAPTTTESGAPDYDFSAVSPVVQDFVDRHGLDGAGLIIVHRDDGVVHHEHWGEFDEDRASIVASSSKMISAGVLMRLHDDGLLDIDAPVAKVVGWGAANPEVTPAQLVSNSSGLVGLIPDPTYGPYSCQYLPTGTLQQCGEAIFATSDDDADITAPDTEFRYGGAQWQVAGAVAEVASGKSWAELIDEIYVQPCGIEVLGYTDNDFSQLFTDGFRYPTGFDPSTLVSTDNPNIEGGAYVTTGDYGKLLLMHLRGGVCGDEQVLSADALARLHGDRIDEAYDGGAYNADTGYGMGWWIDRESGRQRDPGAYGSEAWLDLDDGYGAFLVLEADGSSIRQELLDLLYPLVDDAVNNT